MAKQLPLAGSVENQLHRFFIQQLWMLPICLALAGCMTASQHQKELGQSQDRAITLGMVQKEIKVGMTQADVATALGSPNIVTGDSPDREVWIYDKIASEVSYSNDSGNISSSLTGNGGTGSGFPIVSTGPSGPISGNINGNYSKNAGATSFTQRTLTVIIKFSASKAVESIAYNSTRF